MGADAIRAGTQLDVSQDLAFQQLEIGERGQQNKRDQRGFEGGKQEEVHGLYNCPGASMGAFNILEYRLSVPEVKSVSLAGWIRSGDGDRRDTAVHG